MLPAVIIIQRPTVDMAAFIGISHKVLGRSPAAAIDACPRKMSEAERFLSCLAALRDPEARAGLQPNLLAHTTFSLFMVADERDLLDIIECAAGMPVVFTETLGRGVMAAVFTGTLNQWRDAVKAGSNPDAEHTIRHCFNQIYGLFYNEGLNVWSEFKQRPGPEQTFYLEDKR